MEQIMKIYRSDILSLLMTDIQNDAKNLSKKIGSIAMTTESEWDVKHYVAIVVFEEVE